MKNLEKLGISPAPWKVVPYGESTNSKTATRGDVEFANGESAFMKDGGANLQKIADARIMAAAPKLYQEAYDVADNLLIHLRTPYQTIEIHRDEVAAMVRDLQSALAQAEGADVAK